LLWFDRVDAGDLLIDLAVVMKLRPGYLEGSLDSLREAARSRRIERIIVDCGGVSYVSSTELGKLINLKKVINPVHGRLWLRSIHPDLREVFRICRLDQLFEIEA
jgi:anti-sigma B factor antagonist